MTTEEREEYGVWLKHNGHNCCQSAVEALVFDDESLSSDTRALLQRVASGFRTGMGGMQATCGALCGAVMAAGLKLDGSAAGVAAKQMHQRFSDLSGASICCQLKTKGPNGRPLCECDDCVRHAIRAYHEIVDKRP